MTASSPRVVVLTTGSDYGVLVLRELARRGVAVTAALLETQAELGACFRTRGSWRRTLELPIAIARVLHRGRLARQKGRRLRSTSSVRVRLTGRRNGDRMRRDLASLEPDLVVLGGIGLLDPDILAIPRWGTLNGHPGLLPWVRGNGVVAHALLRDVAVGASAHWVDADIDRGPVVERRLLEVGAAASLPSLESDAMRLAGVLLADVAAACVRGGGPVPGEVQATRHPLCRWATADERRAAEAVVAAGGARRLFDRWAEACRPPEAPWRLPAGVTDAGLTRAQSRY